MPSRQLLLVLALVLALPGCAARRFHLFKGVSADLYDATLEADPEALQRELDRRPASAEPPPTRETLAGVPLTSVGASSRGAWSPDGARIVFQSVRPGGMVDNPHEQTFLMDADGSTQRRVTLGVGRTHAPSFVPGAGLALAWSSTHTAPGTADSDLDLFVQDLQTGAITALAAAAGFDGEPSFCADSSLVVFVSTASGTRTMQALDRRSDAPPRVIPTSGQAVWSPRLSPDCRSVLWRTEHEGGSMLAISPVAGGLPSPLLGPWPGIDDADWMPDGQRVVVSGRATATGGLDLYAMGVDGQDLRRLTETDEDERHPRPSPDGSALLYTLGAGEGAQLLVAPLTAQSGWPYTLPQEPSP